MGSGFVAAGAVMAIIVLRVMRGRATLREATPTLLFGAAIVVTGLLLRVHVPGHDVLRASSALEWLAVFGAVWAGPSRAARAVCCLFARRL